MIQWAGTVDVPILILQGGADRATPPDGALALAGVLEKAGAVYELAVIAGGDHALSRQREQRFAKLLDWYGNPRKKSIAVIVERALYEGGPALARKRFAEARAKPDRNELVELDMNVLGYILLGRNRLDHALAVFELNTQAFPKSANVWDSYGEALLAKGDKDGARKMYERALALDPNMPSAKAALEKLKP